MWLRRQRSGSVLCPSCGSLVGVNDDTCYTCGRKNPGMWGLAPMLRAIGGNEPFVPLLIGSCVVLYVASILVSFATEGNVFGGGGLFSFLGPSQRALTLFGQTGGVPVLVQGRWWTLLSASFLHAGLLHILFNMMALRQLGPSVADMYGQARMVIIYVLSGLCGFALSSFGWYLPSLPILHASYFTVGASASIAGLIGAILYYGQRSGSSMAFNYAKSTALMLLFYGFLFSGIDNFAHLGGFAGGYLAGRVLDPLKPERGDHMTIALALLGLSFAAVVASVVTVIF